MANETQRAAWGSKAGFILAAAGSAVGLGNIWKFPYITGENGGGLFVLIYLVCIALVGVPIMMSEIMIGRAAQKQPVAAFHTLQGKRTGWAAVGWMGVIAGFIILSFYIVVAGWAMDFTLKSVANFTTPIHDTAEVEARTYRATASVDDMRQVLIDRETARESRDEVSLMRRRLKPSAWKDFGIYSEVNATPGINEQALQEDEDFWENVTAAKALDSEIDARVDAIQAEVARRLSAMPDREVRDRAEDIKRREVIFNEVSGAFGAIASDGWTSTFWSAIFMLITIMIVGGGIAGGIERTCKILMPTLIFLIIVMVVYGMTKPGFGEAVAFVFKPDPSKLKASGVLEALGHAFFTLSLGMGAMITYGSYQKAKGGLASESIIIACLDTGIALLACLMMFPILFTYDQDPGAGPGLVFMSMPLAFAEIGRGGMMLAILFFALLVFAALTSAISLLEVVASYFIDEKGWSRHRAAWTLGGVIFIFGMFSAFSSDPDFAMAGWQASYQMSFFDAMDYLSSNWMLPLGGLFIAIYAGWVMPKKARDAELEGLSSPVVATWLVLVRFIAPALVILVLCQKVGILDADELLHGLFNGSATPPVE